MALSGCPMSRAAWEASSCSACFLPLTRRAGRTAWGSRKSSKGIDQAALCCEADTASHRSTQKTDQEEVTPSWPSRRRIDPADRSVAAAIYDVHTSGASVDEHK